MDVCLLAALGHSLALALVLIGFCRIALNLDAPSMCTPCIVVSAAQIAGGAVMSIGILAVTTGVL